MRGPRSNSPARWPPLLCSFPGGCVYFGVKVSRWKFTPLRIFLRVIRRRKRYIWPVSPSKDMKYSYPKYCKSEVISQVMSYRGVADSSAILFEKIFSNFTRVSLWFVIRTVLVDHVSEAHARGEVVVT